MAGSCQGKFRTHLLAVVCIGNCKNEANRYYQSFASLKVKVKEASRATALEHDLVELLECWLVVTLKLSKRMVKKKMEKTRKTYSILVAGHRFFGISARDLNPSKNHSRFS